ncbi:carotenoid oxygenase family protein [Luteipulveratus mongoliensis]|uniref:Dioxygenase n=1 Tax=Luteipulveratus mongoliensis TaxID=571913 RepID=A0A0K1JMM5_9MICO|nr:carotenoid oxygenase family protein [Luteipulveratus mongoliensis]AKU17969.1 carotenoid oxygenase [Luteipulveratus mongoliensis]
MSTDTRTFDPQTDHPMLRGNYAPVPVETTALDLDVTGTIPDYLDGRYLRIGPNPIGEADHQRYEWFSGAGMVHGLRIRDGKADWYRNRWVRSVDVSQRLGEEWKGGPHGGGFDFAANTNVIGHDGRTLAITESGPTPYELDDVLDTVGPSDFCGTLRNGYSAHPHRDPLTGELHAVSYSPLHGNRVTYTVTGTDGRVRRSVDIPMQANVMIHDFSLTQDYVVIYDLPVVLDLGAAPRSRPAQVVASMFTRWARQHPMPGFLENQLMRGSQRSATPDLGLPYRWNDRHQARIGILPRVGGSNHVRWFDIPEAFVYHTLNAYDDGNQIVLELVRYPKAFEDGSDPVSGLPTLERWTIDLVTGSVQQVVLDDRPQEFPRVDERLVSRQHRFGYSVSHTLDEYGLAVPDAVLKHDIAKGSVEAVSFGPDTEPGEFVFHPSSPDAAEDDGVLMGFVYHRSTDRSDLALLDAATLETIATVHVPARVPHGFHGNWVPTEAG